MLRFCFYLAFVSLCVARFLRSSSERQESLGDSLRLSVHFAEEVSSSTELVLSSLVSVLGEEYSVSPRQQAIKIDKSSHCVEKFEIPVEHSLTGVKDSDLVVYVKWNTETKEVLSEVCGLDEEGEAVAIGVEINSETKQEEVKDNISRVLRPRRLSCESSELDQNYELPDGNDVSIPEGCTKFDTSLGKCVTCETDPTGNIPSCQLYVDDFCLVCMEGYLLDEQNYCFEKIPNCSNHDLSTRMCTDCNRGYFSYKNICLVKTNNCAKYDFTQFGCGECMAGYEPLDGFCYRIITGCKTFKYKDQFRVCIECEIGYHFNPTRGCSPDKTRI